ncbi:solute carrier organic anion transporter family member 74D-like [Eurosta solidaginis]|uniref:solute carrier organic anion transporter family member 74D-like n=1 Tax=Eurosta solidaginis TaxID=178769 RepID=UPI003530EC89
MMQTDSAVKSDVSKDSDAMTSLEVLSDKENKEDLKSADESSTKAEIKALLRDIPLTEDVSCGFWIFKGTFIQRLANQTTYVLLYGFVGCVFGMTSSYFNGTWTTLEKRFKIPSKNLGLIAIGNNFTEMIVSGVLSYYAGKGHRPRWIGFGIMTIVVFCWLTAVPHFLYGPGKDALALTSEFGDVPNENTTLEVLEEQRAKSLCRDRSNVTACATAEGNLAPQLVIFLAECISGVGGALYYTLGVSYMDDNTKRSNTPALLSLSYFFHMLGPAIGYALASYCLRLYIAPHLHPIINNADPRWMGAWWLGWLFLGGLLFIFGILFTMLPKELPLAKVRRLLQERKLKNSGADEPVRLEASLSDMLVTFKRLLTNKTLMFNNVSSIFYFFGYMPYWIFTPKYIEIQYRQSAATSSLVTGTVALAFSALGVLLSGLVISKYKPSARYLAGWNVLVGILTVAGCVAYAFIGCPGNEQSMIVNIPDGNSSSMASCNSGCYCDYVPFSPVCGENQMTYISPCHAGCKQEIREENGKKIYRSCNCISKKSKPNREELNFPDLANIEKAAPTTLPTLRLYTSTTYHFSTAAPQLTPTESPIGGQAIPGACPVNCFRQFVLFLTVMCFLKFVGATGRASNFLVSVRCVPEQDKTVAMGFGMMMACMLCFIPSPVFFGWLVDQMCLVWGKTCSNKGNCWLYDPLALRYILNFTAASFIFIGTAFDGGVWYLVKNLKIFDEEDKKKSNKETGAEEKLKLFEVKT